MTAHGRARRGRAAGALLGAALHAALLQGTCACSRLSLSLPHANSSVTNSTHPALVYTGPLASLPLGLLAAQPGLALAAPSGRDPIAEPHIRDALRAAVQVVLPQELCDLFRSATGRDALIAQEPAGGPTFISLHVAAVPELDRVLFNDEATAYIKHLPEYDMSAPHFSALEAALSADELHCAYDHWACDYVARGEVLWPLCQRLRSAYFRATSTDIFKFGLRASEINSAPESASAEHIARDLTIEIPEPSRHRAPFLDRNRARIEDAYLRLVSESATAAAPIRQILYILFGASDKELEEARITSSGVDKLVQLSGSASAYQPAGEPDMRRMTRFLGLFLIVLGFRGCVLAVLGIVKSAGKSGNGARQKRSWRTTAPDEHAGASFSKFLASRAQSFSKTS